MSLTLSEHFYMFKSLSVAYYLYIASCVILGVNCEKNECNDNHGACI